jgi:hypothetical protein
MAMATAITGEVLWTRFTFTPEEVEALRAFRARVLLPDRPVNTSR